MTSSSGPLETAPRTHQPGGFFGVDPTLNASAVNASTLVAPTPRDTLFEEGTARLYRFRRADAGSGPHPAAPGAAPVLLVPSLINRWYILDLMAGSSVASALVEAGLDTYCLDWGGAEDEDRYLTWEQVLSRLRRAIRQVLRRTNSPRLALLGYCMGGTLCGIQTALDPDPICALVNLAGPFDFSEGGRLAQMCDPRWFDVHSIAAAGNVNSPQMQSAFQLLRPTLSVGKWVGFFDKMHDPAFRASFTALETWANDGVAFPAAAYTTYIESLYQRNDLVHGRHHVAGRRVDLSAIKAPVLTIVADKDTICPPAAATALNRSVTSTDHSVITIPGGHVGAVVGKNAPKRLYPQLASWLRARVQ
jgi:polyhydroxyalkanoate synthase